MMFSAVVGQGTVLGHRVEMGALCCGQRLEREALVGVLIDGASNLCESRPGQLGWNPYWQVRRVGPGADGADDVNLDDFSGWADASLVWMRGQSYAARSLDTSPGITLMVFLRDVAARPTKEAVKSGMST